MPTVELQIIADSGGTLSVAPAIELMVGHGTPMVGQAPPDLPLSPSTSAEVTVAGDFTAPTRRPQRSRPPAAGSP